MITAIVLVFVVLPVLAGTMRFVAQLLGWTLRMVFTVAMLPLWIVLAVLGGLAFAAKALLPLLIIVILIVALTTTTER